MRESSVPRLRASRAKRSVRTPPLFAELSRARQVIGLVVIPIAFGTLAALTLKWAGPAWWTWQVLGILGAVIAGLEHLRWWSAATRGAAAGLVAAATVVSVRAFLPGEDMTIFDPVSFSVYAVIASAGLSAAGVALRRRA